MHNIKHPLIVLAYTLALYTTHIVVMDWLKVISWSTPTFGMDW